MQHSLYFDCITVRFMYCIIGLSYWAISSNSAVQLFSCKYVTIKLSWVEWWGVMTRLVEGFRRRDRPRIWWFDWVFEYHSMKSLVGAGLVHTTGDKGRWTACAAHTVAKRRRPLWHDSTLTIEYCDPLHLTHDLRNTPVIGVIQTETVMACSVIDTAAKVVTPTNRDIRCGNKLRRVQRADSKRGYTIATPLHSKPRRM